MAEALVFMSAIQAATQLLEQAFRMFGRLRKAHHRQKELLDVLAQHESELNSIKTIIGFIDDEEALQTATVATELIRLKGVQDKLVKLLEGLNPRPRGSVQQFTHQLTKGSSDENKLSRVMKEIVQVKTMLLLRIEVANVGVIHDMEKRLVANTIVIEQIDRFLREELGGCCKGLKIARLLKGRRASTDGTVPLTDADLKSLENNAKDDDSEGETLVGDSDSSMGSETKRRTVTERVIVQNMARNQAMQINAPFTKDAWKSIDRIIIRDNTAEDEAVQINYPNSVEDTMAVMRLNNEFKMAVRQQTLSFQRRDSMMSPP